MNNCKYINFYIFTFVMKYAITITVKTLISNLIILDQ